MSRQANPNTIKTTFILPINLNDKLKALAQLKGLNKTSIIIWLAEKYIRDECQKLNIDPNQLSSENVNNPPKIRYSEEDPWF